MGSFIAAQILLHSISASFLGNFCTYFSKLDIKLQLVVLLSDNKLQIQHSRGKQCHT